MVSPLQPACPWLANPAEEVHLEVALSIWTWDEKKSVVFCILRTLQKWMFSIQVPVSVLLWIQAAEF